MITKARILTGKVPGEHRRIAELKILKETRFFPCLNDVSIAVLGLSDVGQKIRRSFDNSRERKIDFYFPRRK